jgi:hypothetical protein
MASMNFCWITEHSQELGHPKRRLSLQKADIEELAITLFSMRDLVVKELTPSLRDDFLHFFDSVAFADNPDWSDCYCSAYHFANNKGKAESRREASNLVA